MRITPLKFFLTALLLCPALCAVRAGEFYVPPAAVADEELRGIKDRLSTTLFFRGELADRVMDAGLQDRLVKLTGRETRPEVRLALLYWVKNNPDKAANLYFYLKERKPSGPLPSEAIRYRLPTWELKKNFLELAGAANRAAADRSLENEEVSLAAQRLFEAPQAPPEDYAPLIPGGAPGVRGAGDAGAIRYADYRLHPEVVERERLALGKWFETVKASFDGAVGTGEKGGDQARMRGLVDRTFFLYRDFLVALSNLKGRTKITETEAGKVEAVRRTLRKNLCELEALAAARRLAKMAALLPGGVPGAAALSAEANRLQAGLDAFISGLDENPESVKYAARRLYELENAVDFWVVRSWILGRSLRLEAGLKNRGYSCFFDRLVFSYLSFFFPQAGYVRLSASLSARVKAMEAALKGAADVFSGEGTPLLRQIAEAEGEAGTLREYSKFNRRLQFVFWDALVNPLCLKPAPKGITAGCAQMF